MKRIGRRYLGGAADVKMLVKDDQSALAALKSGRAGIVHAVWRRGSK
jgi:hypothetical protein